MLALAAADIDQALSRLDDAKGTVGPQTPTVGERAAYLRALCVLAAAQQPTAPATAADSPATARGLLGEPLRVRGLALLGVILGNDFSYHPAVQICIYFSILQKYCGQHSTRRTPQWQRAMDANARFVDLPDRARVQLVIRSAAVQVPIRIVAYAAGPRRRCCIQRRPRPRRLDGYRARGRCSSAAC